MFKSCIIREEKTNPETDENNKSLFKVGSVVLYHDKWTSWDSDDIRQGFMPIDFSELKKLKMGDLIWLDEEPLHPQGKVYGYTLVKILKVEKLDSDGLRIHHSMGCFEQSGSHDYAYRIINEKEMCDFVNKNRAATRDYSYLMS